MENLSIKIPFLLSQTEHNEYEIIFISHVVSKLLDSGVIALLSATLRSSLTEMLVYIYAAVKKYMPEVFN